MAGTGLYCTKAVPIQHNDTQNGAPVGQVITLTTGGLGAASAYAGGYVTNTTRAETRSIVSHTDNTVTLEGALGAWLNTDVLQCFDSWATVQGMADQLWIDQAAVYFAAPQKMRVYAGTYDENVVFNAGLRCRWQYALIIEGDPADDRENIVIAPTAGTYSLHCSASLALDRVIVRHMKLAGTPGTGILESRSGFLEVEDCVLLGNLAGYLVDNQENWIRFSDCTLTQQGAGGGIRTRKLLVERCSLTGPGAAGIGIRWDYTCSIMLRGTTISGFLNALGGSYWEGVLDVRNCTFYVSNQAFYTANGGYPANLKVILFNNIFYAVDYIWRDGGTHPPEETSAYIGPRVIMRNNCFYGYTTFWRSGTSHTYAQIAAMDRVDASGDLDATDPLMVAPGSGDFTLQTASPCRRAGVGSGVFYDVNGVPLDPYHPDIGAETTGVSLWRKPEELLEQE